MSAAAPAAPPPKSSKKFVVVAVLATLLLAAGGAGGAWYFLGQKDSDEHAEEGDAPKRKGKPVFSTLEPFTVNLQDERGERFAQIGLVFEIDDAAVDAQIKEHLPAVRNNLLLLISAKRIEDLLSPEGKQVLAEEVRAKAGEALGWTPPPSTFADDEADDTATKRRKAKGKARQPAPAENPIRRVLFSQFIVQ